MNTGSHFWFHMLYSICFDFLSLSKKKFLLFYFFYIRTFLRPFFCGESERSYDKKNTLQQSWRCCAGRSSRYYYSAYVAPKNKIDLGIPCEACLYISNVPKPWQGF